MSGVVPAAAESGPVVLWPMLARGAGLAAGIFVVYAIRKRILFDDFAAVVLVASPVAYASLGSGAILQRLRLRSARWTLAWWAVAGSLGMLATATACVM